MGGEKTLISDKLDRPLHDLRISVTDRCNFRCGYCMPRDVFGKGYQFLKRKELLSYEEIERLAKIFAQLGVKKLRLTGGEPLLRHDLTDLIERLSRIDGIDDVALTTNASLLTRQKVIDLYSAGIHRLNVSLDALTDDIYQKINEIDYPLSKVLDGIDHALAGQFDVVKINMVVQKGVNETDILPMVKYFRDTGAVLRFIEFMDVGNHNQWSLDKVFTASEIVSTINSVYPIEPIQPNYQGEVAKRWKYLDGKGEIGVISSITQPFCHSCSRARLSAIGELYTCLFATSGFDLRQQLRNESTDQEIIESLMEIWAKRSDQYSNDRLKVKVNPTNKVEMSYIGG